MAELILTFRSSGSLVAGERKLIDSGLVVRTELIPGNADCGCGICLVIDALDLGKAKLLLGNNIRSIHPMEGNGKDTAPCLP